MLFKKYSSIDRDKNISGDKYSTFISYIFDKGYYDVKCIAQQKVHGANFGITLNDEGYQANKRNGFISLDAKFFGNKWVELVENVNPRLREIYNTFKEKYPNLVQVKFTCELAGGTFDNETTTKIQDNTNYSVEQFLYFFDIQLFLDESLVSGESTQVIVNPIESVDIFKRYDLYHAKLLTFNGNTELPLSEWIKYNDFTNHVGIELGGKELSPSEGIVIKSIENDRMYCGENRIIVKKINPKYAENKKTSVTTNNNTNDMSSDAVDFVMKAKACVVPMRLDKVCGNQGVDSSNFNRKTDFKKLTEFMIVDIVEDLQKDGEIFDVSWMGGLKSKIADDIAKLIVSKFEAFFIKNKN